MKRTITTILHAAIALSLVACSKSNDVPEPVGRSFQIDTVRIPGGLFLMGSSDGSNIGDNDGSGLNTELNEPFRVKSKEKQHWVLLTKDFHMSKYEITNAQYAEFLNIVQAEYAVDDYGDGYGSNEAILYGRTLVYEDNRLGVRWDESLKRWMPVSDKGGYPAVNVTWDGAKAFAEWVGGDLPTEAQWEYACRGGQSTNLPFGLGMGFLLDYSLANFAWQWSYDWNGTDSSAKEIATGNGYPYATQQVGLYPANGYDLHDMHGNTVEWCLDNWDYISDYSDGGESRENPVIDPIQTVGRLKVVRGGNFFFEGRHCRSAYRAGDNPGKPTYSPGFRVVFP